MQPSRRLLASFLCSLVTCLATVASSAASRLPSLHEALLSKLDVYGEAAMAQTNGPSYEFFEKLLPPIRYVNADFVDYPIVLSAPNSTVKARLISDGSGMNLRGGGTQWNDNGTPVIFRVGPDQLVFGRFPERIPQEPTLAEGYLPIVELQYRHQTPLGAEGMVPLDQKRVDRDSEVYRLESFASTDAKLGEHGVVFVRFSMKQGIVGIVTVQVDAKGPVKAVDGKVTDEKGRVLAWFDKNWKWDKQRMQVRLDLKGEATLAIATKPVEDAGKGLPEWFDYKRQRGECATTWEKVLNEGMQVQTPEPVVNDAWRHLVIQNFELINGDRIHYSQGNQYDKLYESEGSDAMLAMLVWGYQRDARRLLVPLLDFTRKGLEFHQAGFKLNDVTRYYWQTREQKLIDELRAWSKPERYRTGPKEAVSGWEVEAHRLDTNRTGAHGLYPEEQYCGDIHTPVQTLNAASKAWRALRDLGTVLAETGHSAEAQHYQEVTTDFRKTVLMAIEKSLNRSTTPPFIPVALFTNEPAHDPICDVRIGSYWNIIIGYTLGSGIFPPGSEEENWLPHYQEQHGGLFMGLLRSGGMSNTFWNTEYKVNPLYGTRYALDTLRRDDVDRALVCFYGMLAQGFTRNTFECGEGASLVPTDERGRLVSLPPNSAANSHLLSMLRYMLVQDSDLDDDGKPETLRLGFATPKAWLLDGKGYSARHAPSAFGELALDVQSHISKGEVIATVQMPERNRPEKTFLRVRVPDGYKVQSAESSGEKFKPDEKGTIEITGLKGKQTVVFKVTKI